MIIIRLTDIGPTGKRGDIGPQGEVIGPKSAENEHIAVFDGKTGKKIKDGGKKISDFIIPPPDIPEGSLLIKGESGWTILSPGIAGEFLKTQGSNKKPVWATPEFAGDVTGPNTAKDGDIAVFDGDGKHIKDGGKKISNLIPAPLEARQGDILIRTASGWDRLPAGTSGEFLQTQGANKNPVWAESGDVFGPEIAEDERIAVFDNDGKHLKDGGKTIEELLASGGEDSQVLSYLGL